MMRVPSQQLGMAIRGPLLKTTPFKKKLHRKMHLRKMHLRKTPLRKTLQRRILQRSKVKAPNSVK
jgi:hypothetical protein